MWPIIGFILAIATPRLVSVYLYFFTGWFTGVFQTKGWPLLGFVFMPRTMLCVSAVNHWWGGHWGLWQYALLAIAIIVDLGGGKSNYDRRPYGWF